MSSPTETPSRLILWDIDGTLVTTGGAGMAAMVDAGVALFGPTFSADGIDFAGRLDTLIMPDMLRRIGMTPTRESLARFRAGYGERLPGALAAKADRARALPGVLELVDRFHNDPRVAQGIVTGNFAETGVMKLTACGLDPRRFEHNGWGDAAGDGADGSPAPSRDLLPPFALASFAHRHGRHPVRGGAVVIGDTVHDVRCGRVNGCRTIGVATGRTSVEDLAAAGADLALPDLGAVGRIIDFVLSTPSN
ncbi:MAG: HAD family hydrolase [Phycisphaerales bacterium]